MFDLSYLKPQQGISNDTSPQAVPWGISGMADPRIMKASYDPSQQVQPMDYSNLIMAQNLGLQPNLPAPMSGAQSPMQLQSTPMSGPQNVQMPPEIQHLGAVINQYVNNKQDQQNNSGLVQQILSNRMQPELQDASKSAFLSNQAGPGGYVSPDQVMADRYKTQLAPYTEGLNLANSSAELSGRLNTNNIQEQTGLPIAQAKLQEMQQANQIQGATGLPMAMAQLQKEQMTNDIMAKTGLPRAQAEMALLSANAQKVGIENQYLPQMQEADIAAKKAQAGMFGASGGGLPLNGGEQVHGEEFLKSLNPLMGNQVKALAEGRMQFPAGFALKSPYWQSMIAAVSQYDPNFDAVNYNARAKTRSDFTSGKSAQSINALNTVIGHMQNLSNAADSLNNGSIPLVNQIENYGLQATGDPRIQEFGATKKAVIDELTRVYRGAGGSEGDIKTWADQLNAAGSPDQLHGVIATIGDLLESKVNALGEQYNQGMGTSGQPIRLLTPKANAALDTLRQRAGMTSDQQSSQIPPQAVQMLRQNPSLASAFEQKYGVSAKDYMQ